VGARVPALAASRAGRRPVRLARRAAGGLPGPPPLAVERRERVLTAQRIEGQLSAREIGELLGVSARTVRSYWRAGTCAPLRRPADPSEREVVRRLHPLLCAAAPVTA
jgi:hypothetical protein